jgi:hypothetical protein
MAAEFVALVSDGDPLGALAMLAQKHHRVTGHQLQLVMMSHWR